MAFGSFIRKNESLASSARAAASTIQAQTKQAQLSVSEAQETKKLIEQMLKRTAVPAFLVSDGLVVNNLPADAQSESGLFGVAALIEEATPAGALTTSLAGTGNVVLEGTGDQTVIPGVVLEFATNASTSQPSAISGRVRGHYVLPPRFSAATGDLRNRGAAYEQLTFDTGVFTITPQELGAKYTMIILGHQVVNSRTFLRALQLAGALVNFVEATPLVLDITTAPTGIVTTMTALTPTHHLYPQVIAALTAKDFAP